MAVTGAPFVSIEAARLARNFSAVARHVPPFARNHVHHAEESVVSVQTRSWPANDFHLLNQVHVENKFGANESAVGEAGVDAMPIDQHQHTAVEISPVEPANPQERIIPVIAHAHSADALQNVRQGSVAILFYIIRVDDAD